MGLSYDSGDSESVKTALSANLTAASAALDKLENASKRLLAGLGTGELSGKGYSAVDALFAWVVVPCITRAKGEIDAIRGELDTYVREDAKVSRWGVLKEDELTTQLVATTTQRDATERLMEANSRAADSAIAVPGLSESLRMANTQLELVLNELERQIRDLEDRLTALQAFASATQGLFRDGLSKLDAAIRDTVALLEQLGGGVGIAAPTARAKALVYLTGLGSSKDWSTATAAELSSLLNDVSPSQMKALLAAHPELLQRFWNHPPAPEKTAAWWKKLDATQRKEWAKAVPRLVGNLDGVPPRVRSDANRECLKADIAGQYGNAAEDLRQQQSKASGVPRDKISVLSWLDYDPPGSTDVLGVIQNDLATEGAERLGNTLRGLTAVKDWPANAAGLSVVAHSYGTNVATLALTQKGVTAGHVVLLGSAGIAGSVPTAAALHVPGGEVYATQGTRDGWARIGQTLSGRLDPTSPSFGAHPFSAEATTLDGLDLKGITKHGPFGNGPKNPDSYSYLDNLTSAQYATAMATMGRGQEIPTGGTPQDRSAVPNPQPRPSPTPSGARQ